MPSRRRKELVRAFRMYEERGFQPHYRYAEIKAFVKSEKLPYFAVKFDEYAQEYVQYVARLIQAPHDETHLDAGPYLKPLVARLKRDWSADNWLFYASVGPEKLDTWLNRVAGAQSYFWADYSSFDATYSPEAWAMIEKFYAQLYPSADPRFWRAIDAWRQPHGSVKLRKDEAWIKYLAPVMNASGRDDTALANALFNGIALACALASVLCGVDVLSLQEEHIRCVSQLVNIAVVGDDSLVACSVDIVPLGQQVVQRLEQFGLKVKACSSRELVDVTFLASMPYPVGDKYYWGPTLGRRLYKAFWQEDPVGNLPAWVKGVAQQLALFRHVPLLSDISDRILQLLPGGKITTQVADPNRLWQHRETATPGYTDQTVHWLARRYQEQGLTAAQVRADIRLVQGITRLPAVGRFHTTDAALRVDDL
jgi:hypothetical protein